MKFKLPIHRAYDLQFLLNSVYRLRRAVPNRGIRQFQNKWAKWTSEQKREFLSDVIDILAPYMELRRSEVFVEAEIEDH